MVGIPEELSGRGSFAGGQEDSDRAKTEKLIASLDKAIAEMKREKPKAYEAFTKSSLYDFMATVKIGLRGQGPLPSHSEVVEKTADIIMKKVGVGTINAIAETLIKNLHRAPSEDTHDRYGYHSYALCPRNLAPDICKRVHDAYVGIRSGSDEFKPDEMDEETLKTYKTSTLITKASLVEFKIVTIEEMEKRVGPAPKHVKELGEDVRLIKMVQRTRRDIYDENGKVIV